MGTFINIFIDSHSLAHQTKPPKDINIPFLPLRTFRADVTVDDTTQEIVLHYV